MARTENKRANIPNKIKLRNLTQYKNMTDEEFDETYNNLSLGISIDRNFEERTKAKIEEFGKSYDLSDLNSNDHMNLRSLAQAFINLEDYEQMLNKLKLSGIDNTNVLQFEKLNNILSTLRKDISQMQNDLMITRSKREVGKNQSVINFIDDLKQKAKEFYEQRMSYIFCPKCGMLLGTLWTQYPNDDRNKITLVCGRRNDDGTTCGEKFSVRTDELIKSKGTNRVELLPESMR